MRFANLTNTDRDVEDEDGNVIETVRSYAPAFDLTGPGAWLP